MMLALRRIHLSPCLGAWDNRYSYRARSRLRARAYVSTAAAPAPAADDDAPRPEAPPAAVPTIFSSRAKIAPSCPPWLKTSRGRANLELEEIYSAEYSTIWVATPRPATTSSSAAAAAAAAAAATPSSSTSAAAPSPPASSSSSSSSPFPPAAQPHRVVIKAFPKHKLLPRPDLQQKLKQEWDIHTQLAGHPNVIDAYAAVEDDRQVGIYMEHAGESDAYSYLSNKRRLSLREDDARQLMRDVLSALAHMHAQGIVHRDVKSENVFRTQCGAWKLGDFGSALRLGGGGPRALERQVLKLEGTFSFAAPEYVRIWKGFQRSELIEATTYKLDAWSAGALAYDVLCGRAPFALTDQIPRDEEAAAILHAEPEFPSGLSYQAVSFMLQALEKNPQKRPSVRQLLAHPWFDPPREAERGGAGRRRSRASSGGSSSSG